MNKILYGLSIFCLIILAGCSHEDPLAPEPRLQEGKEITVSFSAVVPEFKTVLTRANGGVNNMYLLVFDEYGNFIVRRRATLIDQSPTGGKFTAQLPATTRPRTIHLISNFEDYNDTPGVNEAGVIALMNTENATFWSRVELNDGISETSFNGITVELLRNQAKISVENEADNFSYDGFTIHNKPEKGTVAPYSVANGFTEGTITEPSNVALIAAQSDDISTHENGIYLFERKNAAASNITTVIVKGTYSGQPYYYKIDLIDTDKSRYDIERNYHYIVRIQNVTRAGYTSFNDALEGASHNNTALDPIIERYPMISDGTSKLEVERTLVVLTQPGQTFQVWAKYFPDATSEAVNNSDVTVAIQTGNEALDATSFTFDRATGIISATAVGELATDPKVAVIRVSQGELARSIRVVLRAPFSFNPVTINNGNPGLVSNGQSQDAILRFQIPDDFPDDLFPLPVRIYTQGLYAATAGLEMIVESGQIHYIYRATQKGEQTVQFKTNKSDNSETVTLQSNYFTDGTVNYYPDNIKISGTIEYYERYQFLWWRNRWSNVPRNATVSVSGVNGTTMQVTSNGNYTFTIPYTSGNPSITFTYSSSDYTYRQTISLNNLKSNTGLRLDWVN